MVSTFLQAHRSNICYFFFELVLYLYVFSASAKFMILASLDTLDKSSTLYQICGLVILAIYLGPKLHVRAWNSSLALDQLVDNEHKWRGILTFIFSAVLLLQGALFTYHNLAIDREGRLADRFKESTDMLGSDKLLQRINALHELKRIMEMRIGLDEQTGGNLLRVQSLLTVWLKTAIPDATPRELPREPWKSGPLTPIDALNYTSLLPPHWDGSGADPDKQPQDIHLALLLSGECAARLTVSNATYVQFLASGTEPIWGDGNIYYGKEISNLDCRSKASPSNWDSCHGISCSTAIGEGPGRGWTQGYTNCWFEDSHVSAAMPAQPMTSGAKSTSLDKPGLSIDRSVFLGCDAYWWKSAEIKQSLIEHCEMQVHNFSGAQLDNVSFRYSQMYNPNFTKAHLRNVYFEGANLADGSFADSEIAGCSFRWADLGKASFRNAKIGTFGTGGVSSEDPPGTRYFYCDFAGANLSGTDFRGVDLSNVIGISSEQLAVAQVDDKTVLPVYLRKATDLTPDQLQTLTRLHSSGNSCLPAHAIIWPSVNKVSAGKECFIALWLADSKGSIYVPHEVKWTVVPSAPLTVFESRTLYQIGTCVSSFRDSTGGQYALVGSAIYNGITYQATTSITIEPNS